MGKDRWKNSRKYGARVKIYRTQKDMTYYITLKVGGRKIVRAVGRKSNGWSEKRAFEYRAKLIDKLKHGLGVHSESLKVEDLALEYFEYSEIHRRNHQKVLQVWEKHIAPRFAKKVIDGLSDRDIVKFQKNLLDKRLSAGTINKVVGYLTTVINFGVKKGLIEHSPFKNIEKLKVDNSRKRFLSLEEIEKLYKTLKTKRELYLFVLIALNTGARAGAILKMKKSDFDFINNKIKIYDMKRDMYYTNPLNSSLKSEIEKNCMVDKVIVELTYEQVRIGLKPIFDKLFNMGLSRDDRANRVSIHTLRHTFASHLALQNTPLDKIKKLMNHADIKMTLRYAHLMSDAGEEFVGNLYSN